MLRSKYIIRISRHFKQLPLPFKRCVEIVLVCNYQLRAVSNEKFRYLNEQLNDKQNGSDNVKGTEFLHEIVHVTEFFEKKTECSTKPKLFNSYVFALAKVGNNPICLLLYTVRYFLKLFNNSLRKYKGN